MYVIWADVANIEKEVNVVDFRSLLNKKYVLLDGAMGTMLQARGLKLGGIPEEMNITDSETIKEVHKAYINAGSDIIYSNTFGANGYKLSHSKYSVNEIVSKGIQIAREAIKEEYNKTGKETLVALDIGPIGQLLEPTGTLSFEDAYNYYKEMIIAGKDADLIVFETETDLLEVKAAVLAAKENSNLPVMVTMTFEKNHRTFTGCSISSMARLFTLLGVDALGVNCSLGPDELVPIVDEMRKWTSLPLVVKANAGLPDPMTNTYDISPADFANSMKRMADMGVKIYGGCCGTNEEYIKAIKNTLDNYPINENIEYKPVAMICSPTNTVVIDEPRIIGERINPTGKKKFKEALINNDIDYILSQAIEQVDAGADILDVNVGLPGIDEKEMMVTAIKAVQGVVDVPLQIDSTIPEVLEAALRVYSGIPIVNSCNGEEKSMKAVLPLVKKYGACVVGLTLDENGIPKTADGRFEIAKRILDEAISLGIPKENVFIDCLTLTASAEQAGVMETLYAVKRVKEELGLKTVLGVSNISFGLPNRELVNQAFLTMALQNGLDLPIMNPNVTAMTGAFLSYKVLANIDENSMNYINKFSDVIIKTGATAKTENTMAKSKEVVVSAGDNSFEQLKIKLSHAIDSGLKNEGAEYTKLLLENDSYDSMSLINEILIPALDKTGDLFEKGKIFLPQLILSASVAQSCFEVIKNKMSSSNQSPVSKGKIVLCTVKGDIHDIGKNIVKVLLENYGYTVIDLGKDVDYQKVVDAAIEHKVKLVGLSALMTTTLVSMKETIALLRENNVDCKVVVGGAVLTPEYAKEIGADYYAKDAKETVDIAKEVIG